MFGRISPTLSGRSWPVVAEALWIWRFWNLPDATVTQLRMCACSRDTMVTGGAHMDAKRNSKFWPSRTPYTTRNISWNFWQKWMQVSRKHRKTLHNETDKLVSPRERERQRYQEGDKKVGTSMHGTSWNYFAFAAMDGSWGWGPEICWRLEFLRFLSLSLSLAL